MQHEPSASIAAKLSEEAEVGRVVVIVSDVVTEHAGVLALGDVDRDVGPAEQRAPTSSPSSGAMT